MGQIIIQAFTDSTGALFLPMHNDLKVEKTKSGVTTRYFYDGSILLAEKVGSQVQKIYINDGQGIVGIVRPIYEGSNLTHYQRLYYLYDSLGSISKVCGEHGLPLTPYSYSPYGTCMNVQNAPINSLQFGGEEFQLMACCGFSFKGEVRKFFR